MTRVTSLLTTPFHVTIAALVPVAALAAPPTGTAYFTDSQNTHVEDATSKSIGQVNMIACFMHAMRPDALVNQGNYLALVDENKCDADKQSSTGNAGATGGSAQATSYVSAVVNSTRGSNSDPMRAKIWVDEDNDGQPSTIFVNLNAAQAPTTSDPYGTFRLDFCGRTPGLSSCMMRGALQAGSGALSYFETEGSGTQSRTTALKLSSVGTTSGSGRLDSRETSGNASVQVIFDFAYNQDYFLRGDQCFSRDATDPATGQSVWRYGLYDSATGERIDLKSGFPIEYTNAGTTWNGFLGYYGLSLPAAATATLHNGSVVQKVDYGGNGNATRTDYTLALAGGKLTRYAKKTRTLRELDQIRFNAWVGNVSGFFAGATANAQYELYWDEASGSFKVTSTMSCDQNGCQTRSLATVQSVAPSFWSAMGGIQGFSQSLGGEVFIDLHGAGDVVQSGSVTVVYRQQSMVYPGEMPSHLYCVNNCDTAATLNGYFTDGSTAASPYTTTSFNNWQPLQPNQVLSYSTDASQGVLIDGAAAAVVYTNATAMAQHPQYQNGVRSGRLVASLSDAECNPGSGTYCDYRISSADTYYIWETGPNTWNQFAAVRDSGGTYVQFDAPLQVTYDVPNGTAFGEYAGKSLVLQYGGFGDLWGVPGQCVSRLTNQPASCDNQDARYVPEFVIPFDPVTGVVRNGNRSYVVKWLDREIRFARKLLSQCVSAGLVPPTGIVLPTAADLKDPSDPASDIYIGTKPVVTTAPRVIQGEVKY